MLRPVLLTVLLVPALSGCVAVAAAGVVSVGVFQYQRNELERDFPNSLQECWKATLEALAKLEITPDKAELGAMGGRVDNQELRLLVERHVEGFTRVRVRIGSFYSADHERRAAILMQEIGESLVQEDELRAWTEKVQGNQPATKGAPGAEASSSSAADARPRR